MIMIIIIIIVLRRHISKCIIFIKSKQSRNTEDAATLVTFPTALYSYPGGMRRTFATLIGLVSRSFSFVQSCSCPGHRGAYVEGMSRGQQGTFCSKHISHQTRKSTAVCGIQSKIELSVNRKFIKSKHKGLTQSLSLDRRTRSIKKQLCFLCNTQYQLLYV